MAEKWVHVEFPMSAEAAALVVGYSEVVEAATALATAATEYLAATRVLLIAKPQKPKHWKRYEEAELALVLALVGVGGDPRA